MVNNEFFQLVKEIFRDGYNISISRNIIHLKCGNTNINYMIFNFENSYISSEKSMWYFSFIGNEKYFNIMKGYEREILTDLRDNQIPKYTQYIQYRNEVIDNINNMQTEEGVKIYFREFKIDELL